jgi:hypothetical protein
LPSRTESESKFRTACFMFAFVACV